MANIQNQENEITQMLGSPSNDENYVTRIHDYLYNDSNIYELRKTKVTSLLDTPNFLERLVHSIIRDYNPEGQIKNPMKVIFGNITIQNNILDTLIHVFYFVTSDSNVTEYHNNRLIMDDFLYKLCNKLLENEQFELLIVSFLPCAFMYQV